MIRKYVLPMIALAGVILAAWTVMKGNTPPPTAQPIASPAKPPFAHFVAGAGIVETSTENIAIGTPVAGLVKEVCLRPGARVQAGEALFRLDDRSLRAELAVRRTNLRVAQETLARLRALPRAEDVPPVLAKAAEARAALDDAKSRLAMWESVPDKRAVNQEELTVRRSAVQTAEARLAQAETALAQLKAGAWQPDLDIAQAQVAAAQAQVQAVETEIDRLTIRAPVAGEVLQVKTRAGEFAPAGLLATPLVLLGSTSPLHVRADVDENDAWRLRAGAPAKAFVRGNRAIATDLQFVRFEPYVIPKRSLTGESAERVDTRVLQVIFSFERGTLPVYVGQLVDVFIEAQPNHAATAPTTRGGQEG